MKEDNNATISISTKRLTELIERAFTNGALSHNQWLCQPDTCWSNVNEDMKEEVSDIMNELND